MLWRWQNRQSHPSEVVNFVSVIPLVSHSFLCRSKAFAFMIGPEKITEMNYESFLQFYQPVMGIPSSRFCLNHKNTALSCSSSLPSFMILAGRLVPISSMRDLKFLISTSFLLMSVLVAQPIPYSSEITV